MDLKPDWSKTQKSEENLDSITENYEKTGKLEFECQICGIFSEDKKSHLKLLTPDDLQTFQCEKCNKTFVEDRALKQHENFCRSE